MIVDYGEQPLDHPKPPNCGAVVWMFGRGLSIECGLKWKEPSEWTQYSRVERIERIKRALRVEMVSPHVHRAPIRDFLMFLAQRTAPEWRHLFVTTNWDYLLQLELRAMVDGSRAPRWLHNGAGSWVHHVNGTVEEGTQHRSRFMLEDDSGMGRTETTEASHVFNCVICERTFVVVDMSFECDTDKYLLRQLNKVEDWMPIGEGPWITVNPCGQVLESNGSRIHGALQAAQVVPVKSTFAEWRNEGYPGPTATKDFRH
jgi:hypothetical protein